MLKNVVKYFNLSRKFRKELIWEILDVILHRLST